jgi:hypothetical protein
MGLPLIFHNSAKKRYKFIKRRKKNKAFQQLSNNPRASPIWCTYDRLKIVAPLQGAGGFGAGN